MTIYGEDKVSSDALRRSERFFWITVFAVLLIYLGRNAFWGGEAKWAEMVREMAWREDFWHPTINWKLTYAAPGFNWLRYPVWWVWEITEWSCRLPGIVCGWLLVLAGVRLGRRFFDRRTALFGGWLLFGSYGLLFCSRTAVPEIAAAMLATWSIEAYLAWQDKPGFFRALPVALLWGAAVLVGRFFPVLAELGFLLPYTIVSGSFRRWKTLAAAVLVVGGLLALLSWAPKLWGDPELIRDYRVGTFWWHMVRGLITHADGREPFYVVPYHWFRLTLPWGIYLVAAIAGVARNYRRLAPERRGLTLGIAGMLVMLTLMRSRSWEVSLPLLPLTAVGLAGALTQNDFGDARFNDWAGKLMYFLAMLCGALALGFAVMIPVWDVFVPTIGLPLIIELAVPLAGLVAQGILLFDRVAADRVDLPEKFGGSVLSAVVLMTAIFAFVYPALNDFRQGRNFWRQNGAALRQAAQENQLISYGDRAGAEMLFYARLPRPVAEIVAPTPEARRAELEKFLRRCQGRSAAVSDTEFVAELDELPPRPVKKAVETRSETSRADRSLNLIYYWDSQNQGE